MTPDQELATFKQAARLPEQVTLTKAEAGWLTPDYGIKQFVMAIMGRKDVSSPFMAVFFERKFGSDSLKRIGFTELRADNAVDKHDISSYTEAPGEGQIMVKIMGSKRRWAAVLCPPLKLSVGFETAPREPLAMFAADVVELDQTNRVEKRGGIREERTSARGLEHVVADVPRDLDFEIALNTFF